jgi:hypothetical protein
MRRLDVDEGACVDGFGEARKEPHGESCARPVNAAQEFVVERGEVQSHWRRRYRPAVDVVNARLWTRCAKLK